MTFEVEKSPSAGTPDNAAPIPHPPAELAPDGRDPRYVPDNWAELLDPHEWRLNAEGLPARRAARVIALRREPRPAILLVRGHDFANDALSWAFTPGGGILPGEDGRRAACRELAEETGIELDSSALVGPVVERSSRFHFHLVTSRQDEEIYLAHLDGGTQQTAERGYGELDRRGWTELERDVLDSVGWWDLDDFEAAVAAGMVVYPALLPVLARQFLGGWDGVVRVIREED